MKSRSRRRRQTFITPSKRSATRGCIASPQPPPKEGEKTITELRSSSTRYGVVGFVCCAHPELRLSPCTGLLIFNAYGVV